MKNQPLIITDDIEGDVDQKEVFISIVSAKIENAFRSIPGHKVVCNPWQPTHLTGKVVIKVIAPAYQEHIDVKGLFSYKETDTDPNKFNL